MNSNTLLLIYSSVLTVLFGASQAADFFAPQPSAGKFDEIDVQRINVREPDGTLRLIVSNTAKAPGLFIRNNERSHPGGRRTAGLIFLNDEGTENGGLVFDGRRQPDGGVTNNGHLSFDQFEQDQVVQLSQGEQSGKRWAALVISDRPETSLFDDEALRELIAAPDSKERTEALMRKQEEGVFGRERVRVGKTRDRESVVLLSDGAGRPRLRLRVAEDGTAAIDFLNQDGGVARSLTP